MRNMIQYFHLLIISILLIQCEQNTKTNLSIELIEATRGNGQEFIWTQARVAVIPAKENEKAVMTLSKKLKSGSDVYYDLYQMESTDEGKTWTEPTIIPSLKIHEIGDGYRRSMSDMTPQWHAITKTVLNIGKSFFYTNQNDLDRSKREVAYACFNPQNNEWGKYNILELPEFDNDSNLLVAPCSGCVQFSIEENGDVFLPIYYYALTPEQQNRVSRETFIVKNFMKSDDIGSSVLVAKCSFNGKTLKLLELGNSFTIKQGRGLGEPSIVRFKNRWYMTIRSDKTAYVSTSSDGLNYSRPKEWRFDNDSILGSYNTQQHWAVLKDNLYLVYTRPAGYNDHVFRHRAPLFIARVDEEKVVVLKDTEQICVPEDGIALGNFGVTQINENEIWVVTSEYLRNEHPDKKNRVWVAKLKN